MTSLWQQHQSACCHVFLAYFNDHYFLDCRDEIASCSERAYKQLSVSEAQKLMLFSSAKEALQYAEEVN